LSPVVEPWSDPSAASKLRAMRRRVLYLGLPLGALCLAHDGLEIVGACISRPDQPGRWRLRRRIASAPVLEKPDLSDRSVVERLRALGCEQIVSWFWTKQIPEDVIALAPFAFNVHPSLLPRHRGADPYFWTLACADRVSGVSAHLLSARYDEGPILAQREMIVPEGVNAWQLARRLDRPSLALMREIATRYAHGEDLAATPQEDALATHAPEPSDGDCELRWSWPTKMLLARIRAAAPWPGAFTAYADRTIVITRAEAAPNDAGLSPGIAALDRSGVIVASSDGALRLVEAHDEEDPTPLRGLAIATLFPGLPSI
jgi:methionyl-tRNA formyltransferase